MSGRARGPRRASGVAFAVLLVFAIAVSVAVAAVPLSAREQAIFALGSAVAFLIADRLAGRTVTLLLSALSAIVTLRYLTWRIGHTIPTATWAECALGIGLIAAECYAAVMLVLGYVQAAWPLGRLPVPLPDDPRAWPTVDVFIPTIDEPLDVVRVTVLAALAMDWPPDALTVWLLDDGARPEFARFAAEVGCVYLARDDRRHAKAGNLNGGLVHSRAAFVCVLDCDHVPTRAFLQLTMGWLVADPNIAWVQTPQRCYSPDPFQRNLSARIAADDALFHFLLQDGADTWNAAFFTGTGGVLRRAALDDIGGFAVETVTEDVHTSLRLHRRGWDSAYLRLALAGGLAPPTLAAHIRQRARWARGLMQVLRRDNPLLGAGLSATQRLCYLRAAAHFLFPLPRLAFMTAPLAFLLAGQHVIAASPLAVTAYGLPHVLHAVATRARIDGRWRRPFWGGVSETVLAPWLAFATLWAFVRPRRGRFTVTPKDGITAGTFDWRATAPAMALAVLLAAGVARGVVALTEPGHDLPRADAMLFNALWAAAALPLALAAVAVGREAPQPRRTARIPAALPVAIAWQDGAVEGMTRDLSIGGAQIEAARPDGVADDAALAVWVADDLALPARIVGWTGTVLRLRWCPATLDEQSAVIETVFGRADTWSHGTTMTPDRRRTGVLRAIGIALVLTCLIGGSARAQEPAERRLVFTLGQLGAAGPIALRGTNERGEIAFGLRADEVVTAAQLDLAGAVSPSLSPELSNVTVTVNGRYLGTISADPNQADFSRAITIDPVYLQDRNRLGFRLSGRAASDCDDPLSGLLWATVYDSSTLTLTVRALPALRTLTRLPLPLFDAGQTGPLSLPVILPGAPDDETLNAAAIVASWFGQLAGGRGAGFPVVVSAPATGNAVLIATGASGLPGMPPFDGPTVAVVANPNDASSTILVVGGRSAGEAAVAASALASDETRLLGGQSALVTPPTLPERRPDDAPNWIPSGRTVRLGELVDAAALQEAGYVGLLHVPFRAVPDFDTRTGRSFPLDVAVRSPPGPVIDVATSRLDVGINGQYLGTISLGATDRQRIRIPADDVHGSNDLEFYFDARPLRHAACGAVPGDLRMAIDADSTIDLSDAVRVTELPNLASFVGSGFPFTRLADLSRTAIVLPERPSPAELSAFLGVLGRMGAATGTAAFGVSVVRPRELSSVAGRDLIVLGTVAAFGNLDTFLGAGPIRLADGRVTVALPSALDQVARVFGDPFAADRARAAAILSAGLGADTALMVGEESPLTPGRSVVALLAAAPDTLLAAVASLDDDRVAASIRGDFAILSGSVVTSYRTRPPYTVGMPPWWYYPTYLLGNRPVALLAVTVLGAAIVGAAGFWELRRRADRRLATNRHGAV